MMTVVEALDAVLADINFYIYSKVIDPHDDCERFYHDGVTDGLLMARDSVNHFREIAINERRDLMKNAANALDAIKRLYGIDK